MNQKQKEALIALKHAFALSTMSGLFDCLQPFCKHPDSINDVADAYDAFSESNPEPKAGDNIRITMVMKANEVYPADEPACAKFNTYNLVRNMLFHNMEKQLRLMSEKPETQVLRDLNEACLKAARVEQMKINELLNSMQIELF